MFRIAIQMDLAQNTPQAVALIKECKLAQNPTAYRKRVIGDWMTRHSLHPDAIYQLEWLAENLKGATEIKLEVSLPTQV